MSRVRSQGNKSTELAFVKLLTRHHIAGWRRHANLPGRPDFCFRASRLAVFVDGCFWHSCPIHSSQPQSNVALWQNKFARNKIRAGQVRRELRTKGWRVLRIWEHQLAEENAVVRRLKKALGHI